MEPMTLGSPNASFNASAFDSNTSASVFLPSFLLGSDSGQTSDYASPRSFSPNKSQYPPHGSSSFTSTSIKQKNNMPSITSPIEKHDGPPIISLTDYSTVRSLGDVSMGHTVNGSPPKIRDGDDFLENWITIFGFSNSQIDLVLSYFARFGHIVDKKHSVNGGNWIHVKYCNRREALSALSQNGRLISSNLMIGVISRKEKHNLENSNQSFSCRRDSDAQKSIIHSPPFIPNIRRLAVTNSENEVIPTTNLPSKSSGIVSKSIEYLFGW